jgi:starvation-inducible DNA-binding protein
MKTIPLERNICEEVASTIAQVLANTYVLYTKTQNFHWNLVDPRFYSLHLLFEKQYEELADAVDLLAERMRMIGAKSPGAMRQFIELASLEESEGDLNGDQMIQELMEDHTLCANVLRPLVGNIADLGDEGTSDLFVSLLRAHEKNAWMLRSHHRVK